MHLDSRYRKFFNIICPSCSKMWKAIRKRCAFIDSSFSLCAFSEAPEEGIFILNGNVTERREAYYGPFPATDSASLAKEAMENYPSTYMERYIAQNTVKMVFE